MTIHKQAASLPQKKLDLDWQELLPSYAQSLAEVIESIVGSAHPYEHQRQALDYLLEVTTEQANTGLIINGGTYSGKSLSFSIPGIVKLLGEKTDFMVVFYPSKQLLLDQFERMKEYLVKLEEVSGKRLTCKVYSGDISRTNSSNSLGAQTQQTELAETEQNPPNILLATFDKVWYQLITGKNTPLLEKIIASQYLVFDEIHAFDGFAAAIIRGFVKVHQKKNPQSQIILSSATINNVAGFRDDFLPNAKIITCPPVRGEQEFLGTTVEHAVSILAELWCELETLPGKVCLVFLDSKEDIELLSEKLSQKLLQEHPFFDDETVAIIHADLPYFERKKILDEVRKKSKNIIRILFSSSVLELGVNLPNVQTVINIGIPITQKDGIVQRFARNRSTPGDRRVNVFMFNLNNQRDVFYWNNREILAEILETNACNPILYPRLNPTILAGMIVLHLRYGFTLFEELMQFFLQEGVSTYQAARQQYTKLVSYMVLKKEDGRVLFTSQAENILKKRAAKNDTFIPLSIRAIGGSWAVKQETGLQSSWHSTNETQIGTISAGDVLRRGLPGNIIMRNKEKYLVTEIDRNNKSIFVKKFVKEISGFLSPKTNRLYDPTVSMGVFPKKVAGTKLLTVMFGQLFVHQQPAAIANFKLDTLYSKQIRTQVEQSFFWQELSRQESEEFTLTEQSEGLLLTLQSDLPSCNNLSKKKILEYLGKVLQIEIEVVLSIPSSELALVCNNSQIALYDKGGANGNAAFLIAHFQRVAQQTLERLTNCPCNRGCKDCYGLIFGQMPVGLKKVLQTLVKDLIGVVGLKQESEQIEVPACQLNFQENRIIALSDIHLTNELCFQEDFFETLSHLSKQADILILNGDLLDKVSEESRLVFAQLKSKAIEEGVWSKLVLIRSSSIHDGIHDLFTGFLHQDYALLEIGSEQVLFVHGNKIGLNPHLANIKGPEVAAIQAKRELIKNDGRSWLPTITEETHLVLGHLHHRFYNERFRVYGIGHWLQKGSPRHQRCFLLLDPTNSLDTIQLHSYAT